MRTSRRWRSGHDERGVFLLIGCLSYRSRSKSIASAIRRGPERGSLFLLSECRTSGYPARPHSAPAPFLDADPHPNYTVVHRPQTAKDKLLPPTRLTQRHKREAKGAPSLSIRKRTRQPQNICQGCGSHIRAGKKYCVSCAVATSTERLLEVAKQGRVISVSPEVNARRAEKMRGHNFARWGWAASSQPAWLTNKFYESKIQPLLANIPRSTISTALGVSKTYAGEIRAGKSLPHPRHWQALAKLVGVSS
jgi:hypothetical protein